MLSGHMPRFVNHASCSDHDPQLWFPEEQAGRHRTWTKTPEVMKAREICSTCPAIQECLEYSLKYSQLYGIWAGLDWYERDELQKSLNLTPVNMTTTIPHYYKEGIPTDVE